MDSDFRGSILKIIQDSLQYIKPLPQKYFYFIYGYGADVYNDTISNLQKATELLESSLSLTRENFETLLTDTFWGVRKIRILLIEGYEPKENWCLLYERLELIKLQHLAIIELLPQ